MFAITQKILRPFLCVSDREIEVEIERRFVCLSVFAFVGLCVYKLER